MKRSRFTKAGKPRRSETKEQIALTKWVDLLARNVPPLEMYFHVPNGGARPATFNADGERRSIDGAILKAMGARKGVFDVFVDWAVAEFHGLRLELKVVGGKPSDEQKEWFRRWTRAGYCARFAFGWVDAAHVIADYLAPALSAGELRAMREALPFRVPEPRP